VAFATSAHRSRSAARRSELLNNINASEVHGGAGL